MVIKKLAIRKETFSGTNAVEKQMSLKWQLTPLRDTHRKHSEKREC